MRISRTWLKSAFLVAGVVILGLIASLAADGVRWRARVLARVALGKVTDLSLVETVWMLRPNASYYLRPLVDEANPFAVITNRHTSLGDAAIGAKAYQQRCSECHQRGAANGTAPDLAKNEFRHGGSDWALYRHITKGIPGTAMAAQPVSDGEAWQVITYVRSLALAEPVPHVAASDSEVNANTLSDLPSVSASRLTHARTTPNDWLMYSGAYDGWRFSALEGITPANISHLRTHWIFQAPTEAGSGTLKTSPVVVDGVMFVTSADQVFALNGKKGTLLWTYSRNLPEDLRLCCGRLNRGVAVAGNKVYVATLDAHLVALEAKTGKVVWDVEMGAHAQGYSGGGAPLAIDNRILVGIAGGEFGARGFIDAYDAESGLRLWRFYTVPGTDEKGNETWGGESWKRGGAPTWLTGSYDPDLHLVYWGVGNPSPDFSGESRPGDNLYSNSVVALDVATGHLRWHFQFTPHDEHDWDAVHVPILIDAMWNGAPRHLLVEANRNGFYYVLDRENGQFLLARPFVRQNWTTGIDAEGRPIPSPNASPSAKGTLTYPSGGGGTNWQSSAFSPKTGYVYVPVLDRGGIFFKQPAAFRPGDLFLAGTSQTLPQGGWSAIQAIRAETGEKVWERRFDNERRDTVQKTCGLVATGGGVVFGCRGATLIALDAKTGGELWNLNTGSIIAGAPVSFEVDGSELLTVTAGGILMTLGL